MTRGGEKEGQTGSPVPSLVWTAPGVGFSLGTPSSWNKRQGPAYRDAW